MRKAWSLAGLAALAFVCFAVAARAEDPLFTIHMKDGSKSFAVTREIIERTPKVEYAAVLPGGAGDVQKVRGPLLKSLLSAAGLGTGARVWVKGLDGYQMDIPMSDMEKYDVMAATEVNGEPLSVRDRGPVWIVYPTVDHPELRDALYEARSVWQVKELTVE